jgi:hypothetical protein
MAFIDPGTPTSTMERIRPLGMAFPSFATLDQKAIIHRTKQ